MPKGVVASAVGEAPKEDIDGEHEEKEPLLRCERNAKADEGVKPRAWAADAILLPWIASSSYPPFFHSVTHPES